MNKGDNTVYPWDGKLSCKERNYPKQVLQAMKHEINYHQDASVFHSMLNHTWEKYENDQGFVKE